MRDPGRGRDYACKALRAGPPAPIQGKVPCASSRAPRPCVTPSAQCNTVSRHVSPYTEAWGRPLTAQLRREVPLRPSLGALRAPCCLQACALIALYPAQLCAGYRSAPRATRCHRGHALPPRGASKLPTQDLATALFMTPVRSRGASLLPLVPCAAAAGPNWLPALAERLGKGKGSLALRGINRRWI